VASSSLTLLYNTATNLLTINLASGVVLAAGDYRLTLLAAGITDTNGQPLTANTSVDFHVLPGDANGDRAVNDRDLFVVWQNSLRPLDQQNPNADVNGDGQVTAADVQLIKNLYLTTVPPAALLGGGGQGTGGGAQQTSPVEPGSASPPVPVAPEGIARVPAVPAVEAKPPTVMDYLPNNVAVEHAPAAQPAAPGHGGLMADRPAHTDGSSSSSLTGIHSAPTSGRVSGWVPFRWPQDFFDQFNMRLGRRSPGPG
jgi:hypothetical protein